MPAALNPEQQTLRFFFLDRDGGAANDDEGANFFATGAEQFFRRFAPACDLVARLVQEIVKRAYAGRARVVGRSVRRQLGILFVFFLNIRYRIDRNQNYDRKHKHEYDSKTLS